MIVVVVRQEVEKIAEKQGFGYIISDGPSGIALVCANKYNLNDDNTRQIESCCLGQRVEMAAKATFDNIVTRGLSV